ncbi:Peptidyl-prolyl cis-trans isomerase [Aphelenchoides bicaudatus]|nr:Peptidyl-prolyl cis-trans isomerase [Aphelenchoides bicaudatus]
MRGFAEFAPLWHRQPQCRSIFVRPDPHPYAFHRRCRHPPASRSGAETCRAHHEPRERRLLRRRRFPPRDPRFHGAGRRSDGHRHGRVARCTDLPQEFSSEPHVRGVCSMARAKNPNSANSQFFICFDDAPFLDNQYTVWGEVIEGMDNVDALPKGEPPREPGKIVKATVS